ncbi:SseB family protein [Streptomyces sp. SCA3-4]|uniref:SseB family protein n=1 Tax=Streptomyces sichuanensis TaxID=2871810 RepID=UPI001CE367EF|nr:SseB family protein [Streptomyces sichuanensis]MCA6095045.1 SseB family protein [Streptomyces sichuanensis]
MTDSPPTRSPLAHQIAAVHAHQGHPASLVGEFRRAAVLVPFDEAGGLWAVEYGGVRWVCAFTDEAALARFAVERGLAEGQEWRYLSVFGARLLDVVVPQVGGPAGVALDVGSERPMMFPPVRGIVPDAVALDAAENRFANHVEGAAAQ